MAYLLSHLLIRSSDFISICKIFLERVYTALYRVLYCDVCNVHHPINVTSYKSLYFIHSHVECWACPVRVHWTLSYFLFRRGNDSGFSPYQSYRDCVWSWRPLLRLLKNVTLKMSNFSVESSLYVFWLLNSFNFFICWACWVLIVDKACLAIGIKTLAV